MTEGQPKLILKRAPIGDNQDDYDVLENGDCRWPHFQGCQSHRQTAPGCGRAATRRPLSSARHMDTKRHAKLRWRRSLRAGAEARPGTRKSLARPLSGKPDIAADIAVGPLLTDDVDKLSDEAL